MTRDEQQIEDLEPDVADAEAVVGGAAPRLPDTVKAPPPSGPVPVPYPNAGGDPKSP